MGPNTPHGKNLMQSTMHQLNLPPEEWANDVKDLNSQLIECLEQLYDRENELQQQQIIISSLEENLISVKQQTTALYYDYTKKSDLFDSKIKQMETDNKNLNEVIIIIIIIIVVVVIITTNIFDFIQYCHC